MIPPGQWGTHINIGQTKEMWTAEIKIPDGLTEYQAYYISAPSQTALIELVIRMVFEGRKR